MADKTKILFVVTNHATLGDTREKTGFHLSEMTEPFIAFAKANIDIDIASPKGGEPPIDPSSYDLKHDTNREFMENNEFRKKIENTLALREINTHQYQGIYFPGGHGTMWDFPNNPQIEEIVRSIYESGGMVAAICHGPAAFVGLRLTDGDFLVQGKKLTGFTNPEEIQTKKEKIVPFLLQDKLIEQGAQFVENAVFQENVVQDGRLITGQNPASALKLAEAVIKIMV